MKYLNWNLEWKKAKSKASKWISRKFDALDPDVACLTETTEEMIPVGEVLKADPDYGYSQPGKVHSSPLERKYDVHSSSRGR